MSVVSRNFSDRRRFTTSRGPRPPSASMMTSMHARWIMLVNAEKTRANSRYVGKERWNKRRVCICVPSRWKHVRLNRFNMILGGSSFEFEAARVISERFGTTSKSGTGAKSLGSAVTELTSGLRCGLARRKSQKSKILTRLLKLKLATSRQRARGRRLWHVREKLCSSSGWSPEWPIILSMTSQGSKGDCIASEVRDPGN